MLAPALLIALATVDFVTLSMDEGKTDIRRRIAKDSCNLDAAIATLNHLAKVQGPMLVVAHANMTPAVLYFTLHRVSAVPIHPAAAAVHLSVELLRSTRQTMDTSGTAFVICPADLAAGVYGIEANSLHARLAGGQAVPGLKSLGLNPLAGGANGTNGIKIFTSTR